MVDLGMRSHMGVSWRIFIILEGWGFEFICCCYAFHSSCSMLCILVSDLYVFDFFLMDDCKVECCE